MRRDGLRLLAYRLVAGVSAVVTALVGFAVWLVLQARYLEDYCFTRAPLPEGAAPEPTGHMPPAYMEDPITVRCEYSAYSDVVIRDGTVLTGAVIIALVIAGACAVIWQVYRHAVQRVTH